MLIQSNQLAWWLRTERYNRYSFLLYNNQKFKVHIRLQDIKTDVQKDNVREWQGKQLKTQISQFHVSGSTWKLCECKERTMTKANLFKIYFQLHITTLRPVSDTSRGISPFYIPSTWGHTHPVTNGHSALRDTTQIYR